MIWLCRHDWKVLDKTELPSAFDRMGPGVEMEGVQSWVFARKSTTVFACTKCGKLKVIRTEGARP